MRSLTLIWLIIISIYYALKIPAWFVVYAVATYSFTQHISILMRVLAILAIAYPVILAISEILAWKFFRRKRYNYAFLFSILPLIYFIIIDGIFMHLALPALH